MTKAEILLEVGKFIKGHRRLPMSSEDDLVFTETNDKGEEVERRLRASGQLKTLYGDEDDTKILSKLLLTDLLDNDIICYEDVREYCDIDVGVGMELLFNGERKNVDVQTRRAVEVFLGCDIYDHLDQKVATLCESCSKNGNSCKNPQLYWVTVIGCKRYSKSKRK